jgi:hypothetical protein
MQLAGEVAREGTVEAVLTESGELLPSEGLEGLEKFGVSMAVAGRKLASCNASSESNSILSRLRSAWA